MKNASKNENCFHIKMSFFPLQKKKNTLPYIKQIIIHLSHMHLESKSNYHNIHEPILFRVETHDGKELMFQPGKVERSFSHHLVDLPDTHGASIYKLVSNDSLISFHYIVHPEMKAIIVPPNAIEMDHTRKNNGIGEQIQSFLETMAHKHQYRLIVGITPESASAFNGRVTKILRQTGYYMGPPSDKANVYF